jgi:hypothetical protein
LEIYIDRNKVGISAVRKERRDVKNKNRQLKNDCGKKMGMRQKTKKAGRRGCLERRKGKYGRKTYRQGPRSALYSGLWR